MSANYYTAIFILINENISSLLGYLLFFENISTALSINQFYLIPHLLSILYYSYIGIQYIYKLILS